MADIHRAAVRQLVLGISSNPKRVFFNGLRATAALGARRLGQLDHNISIHNRRIQELHISADQIHIAHEHSAQTPRSST